MTHLQATNLWWLIHIEHPDLNPQIQIIGNGEYVVRLMGTPEWLFVWSMQDWMYLVAFIVKSSKRRFYNHGKRRKVVNIA